MEDARKLIRLTSRRLARGSADPDFFEFVRRIEAAHRELPRVGNAQSPAEEVLRFGQMPSLKFPPTALASIEEAHGAPNAEALILVYFFGLYGVNGPMPLEVTNYVFERYYNEYDSTLRRFSDILHHRFLTLFYRAWREARAAASFDRGELTGPAALLHALAGAADSTRFHLPTDALETYAGLLYNSTRSADGLATLLKAFLGIPLSIRERITSHEEIPERYRVRLGSPDVSTLGKNMQIGSRFLTRTKVFEIVIGPTSFAACRGFLPGTRGFDDIAALVRLYLDRPLNWNLKFLIRTETLPAPRLGENSTLSRGLWLGRRFAARNTPITELTQDGARRSQALEQEAPAIRNTHTRRSSWPQ